AFANEETGLMGDLKREHGITSASWRAAIAAIHTEREIPRIESAQPNTREFLTPEEAAEALGIHVQTMRAYVRSGRLPAYRVAGERAIRIRRPGLEKVLEPLVPEGEPAARKSKGE